MDKPNYYAILTAEVRYDKRLGASTKLLYAEITALCNSEGYCWASNKYFADLYHVTPRAIQNWLGQLSKCGWIQVHVDKQKGNVRKIYLTNQASLPNEHLFTTPNENLFTHNTILDNTKHNKTISGEIQEGLTALLNERTGKKTRVYPMKAVRQFKARLKEGYTLADIRNTIINVCTDQFHIDNGFKYVTHDYVTRSATMEKYGFKPEETEKQKKGVEYVR